MRARRTTILDGGAYKGTPEVYILGVEPQGRSHEDFQAGAILMPKEVAEANDWRFVERR
jgi:hypothetical protein